MLKKLIFVLGFYLFTFNFFLAHAGSDIAYVEKLFLQEKYEKAIRESGILIDARARQRDELYYIKGLAELKMGRFDPARDSFRRVISQYVRSKRMLDAYVGIGDAYLLEGDAGEAIRHYNEALDKFPDDTNISIVYYRMAEALKSSGSSEKAKQYFDKARAMSPFSFEAKSPFSCPVMDSAVKTKPSPSGESSAHISVQVGCFNNKRNAERLVKKLSREGYESYIPAPTGSGDKLYRVKVGSSLSKDEASRLAAKLKRGGYNTKICADDICR